MNIADLDTETIKETFESFDWKEAFYDPLYDLIEAETEEDKALASSMETLVYQLQAIYLSSGEGKAFVDSMIQKYWKGNPMENQVNSLFPSNISTMPNDHVISDEVLMKAQIEFASNNYWVAYNTISYFLEKGDVQFFRNKDEANEFSDNNISEFDNFRVMHARSLRDMLLKIPYGQNLENELNNLSTKKHLVMNEENLNYLKDNIKYMGFGEKMGEALETNLKQGQSEFSLTNKIEVNKKPFEVTLNFRKSDNSDMYFFNSYKASLTRSDGRKVEETFYLNKGKGITSKEAYNMLEGRAVFKELSTKEGEAYKAWLQMDFDKKDKHDNHEVRQFHENYGYDLKGAISKFAIAELTDTEKTKALMQSLQKGNIQSVSIERDGNVSKMFIEANPQYKTVTLYNSEMKRVQKQELGQYHSIQQSHGKEVKEEQKKNLKQGKKEEVKQNLGDDLDGSKKKRSRKKGLSP